jgi:peptidoglycan/LPS O-acetylase OafA/YrhL
VDILRGFAALSVLVYHVIEYWNWQTFPTDGPLA